MNRWMRHVLQASLVVAMLILITVVYSLIADPTNHEDIVEQLQQIENRQLAFCVQLEVDCE